MQLDIDRRIIGDSMIQNLLARQEIQLEYFSFEGFLPENRMPREYQLDARLFIDFIYEGPEEEPGQFVCRMMLSGEVLMEYARIEGYLDKPLNAILKSEAKAVTLRLWGLICKVAEVNEFVGYLRHIHCPQSDERVIDAGLFKTLLLNDVATTEEATKGVNVMDELRMVTPAFLNQHFTTLSEQAVLASLREENLDNAVVDRVLNRYRKHIEKTFKRSDTNG